MVSTQALADAKDRAARHCPTEAARVDSEAEEEVPEEHERKRLRPAPANRVGYVSIRKPVTKGVQATGRTKTRLS